MAWIEIPTASYTPTVTQSGSVTVTVTYAKYTRIGNFIITTALLTVTGSGTTNNPIVIGFPVGLRPVMVGNIGTAYVYDGSAGGIVAVGNLVATSGTDVRIRIQNPTGATFVGQNPNFALAANDIISFQGAWEV